jgi:hypothetical protein
MRMLRPQPGYLIRVNRGERAHIWTGGDTACRMWSTGGLGTRGYEVHDDPGGRKICQMCARLAPRPAPVELVHMTAKTLMEQLAKSLHNGRNTALEAAILVCEDCVKDGDSAETCLKMLRDLREMLNPRMDS